MAANDPKTLVQSALQLIGAGDRVVSLCNGDEIRRTNFEYADLLHGSELGRRVSAVIEKDGSPLVYVAAIPEDSPTDAMNLAQLLANRGETAILLDVHESAQKLMARAWPCSLNADKSQKLDLTNPIDARLVLGDLQDGLWGAHGSAHQEQRLRDLLVNSVDKVSSALQRRTGLSREKDEDQEVLGLVGRALFTRFLLDREILAANTAPSLWRLIGADGAAAFDTAERAAATCAWLDDTFNGEFMPLPISKEEGYLPYFTRLLEHSPEALEPLGWILHRTDSGGQLPLWEKLDFSHIPAGTLSEVYEDYAHRKAPRQAQKDSVHFTPRHVARMMVRQALNAFPNKKEAAEATILDPAVGAAVFLSLSYRELARRYDLYHDVWPDTEALRDILYKQLCGMDINASALNLAALTLYLTAIELDANPVPPEKLKFKKRLIGSVLIDVSPADDDAEKSMLGSLRQDINVDHRYDVVIGNPPWTSLGRQAADEDEEAEIDSERKRQKEPSDVFVDVVGEIVAKRIKEKQIPFSEKYLHPDKVPDVGFIWKATQWAKPETGVIALIVHQRLLIKQSRQWRNARRALFSSLEVNGIINGGEFANHDDLIWPGIESPFCVLFARNKVPDNSHRISMLTLAVDPPLERRRQIRLDPLACMALTVDEFDELPGGLVVRTKGCELDRALLRRLTDRMDFALPEAKQSRVINTRNLPLTTIERCVDSFARGTPKRGFKTGNKNTKEPEWFSELLENARELKASSKERMAGPIVASDIKEDFTRRAFKSSPKLDWYQPPFLLLRHNAGVRGELARSIIALPSDDPTPILYPYTFIGIPIRDDTSSLCFAKYVAVWVNSSFYSYYQTVTSTQFTFGIKVSLNKDILNIPMMDMNLALSHGLTTKEEINSLFKRLATTDHSLQAAIDEWVYKILGLDQHEQMVIEDTLSVSYPIGGSRNIGRRWVENTRVREYVEQLRQELEADADIVDTGSIQLVDTPQGFEGWRFVTWKATNGLNVKMQREDTETWIEASDEDALIRLVREKYPEGEVWARVADGRFLFGQMALNHLWLPSRACLAAAVIASWVEQSILC